MSVEPPIFISGGKRLNLDRESEWAPGVVHDHFIGYGKERSCSIEASWEELCAFAELIVNHPAFIPNAVQTDYYPPRIVDRSPDA